MFGKKKQQPLFNSIDDSRTLSYDFRLRSTMLGFESFRALEYPLYYKLEESEMIPKLDGHLSKMFSGEIDDANGDMLDSIIFGAAREALPELNRQRYNHIDTLRRLIVRGTVDCKDIERIKQEREIECEQLQIERNELSKYEEV